MALAFRSNSFSKANSSLTTVLLTGSSSTLCLYDTHSLTHTVSLSHTHCLTLSHTLSLSLTHCRTLCLTLSRAGSSSSLCLSLTLSLAHTVSHFLTHAVTLAHAHCPCLTPTLSHSRTHCHRLTHTLSHALPDVLSGRFFFLLFRRSNLPLEDIPSTLAARRIHPCHLRN
jgi:hypothetical protein